MRSRFDSFDEIPTELGEELKAQGLVGINHHKAYFMPLEVHIAWCELCSEEEKK